MRIGIIGGGAAGFFSAIQCKLNAPNNQVTILEKSDKLLAKVKVSGGGRCNVTNITSDPNILSNCYPRGNRQLKKAFREFTSTDTIAFFEERSVPLVAQEDGCIFPVSQSSQTIIDCFLDETKKLGIQILEKQRVEKIIVGEENEHFTLVCPGDTHQFDKLIICTGGTPKREGLKWLESIGQPIVDPVPSLFTFNMPDESIKSLMGVVVPNVITKIQGTKLIGTGPLLITHWGMSGPSILVLSAWGARILKAENYTFQLTVNWTGISNEENVRTLINSLQKNNPTAQLKKFGVGQLSKRLWEFLLTRWNIDSSIPWKDLKKKNKNRLINNLMNDYYEVRGKTTFKEEFVTAGGIDLKHINFKTMESKKIPNLYFAGEILDIDGITGGYNFQAAWTTAFLAARGVTKQ